MTKIKLGKWVMTLLLILPIVVWFICMKWREPSHTMFGPTRVSGNENPRVHSKAFSKTITLTTAWSDKVYVRFGEDIGWQMKTKGLYWEIQTDDNPPVLQYPIEYSGSQSNYLGAFSEVRWRIHPNYVDKKGELAFWIVRK